MLPHAMLSKGSVAMTPAELTRAARNLARGLGTPVYIRDGRIYQHGPGIEFLPPKGSRPAVGDVPSVDEEGKTDEAE
jgi:hypothetical protein